MKRAAFVLAILLALITTFSYYLFTSEALLLKENEFKRSLLLEVFKYTVQFFFVVLLGSILMSEYNRMRQKRSELKAFRKSIYSSLVNEYLKVKKARWRLRAYCNNNEIPIRSFKKEMEIIIDAKVQLEIIIHEITAFNKPFKSIEKELIADLEAMEDFLRELVTEYNEKFSQLSGIPAKVNISEFTSLRGFISRSTAVQGESIEESAFSINFRRYFNNALLMLRENEYKQEELAPATSMFSTR